MKTIGKKIFQFIKKMLAYISNTMSFRQKIMSVILIFTLAPLLIFGVIIINKSISEFKQKIMTENTALTKAKASELKQLIYSNMQKLNYIKYSRLIGNILTTSRTDDITSVMSYYNNASDLFEVMKADGLGSSITIYTNNIYAYNGEYVKKVEHLEVEFVNELDLLKEYGFVIRLDKEKKQDNQYKNIKIYGMVETSYNIYGIIEISIPFNKIEEILKQSLPPKSFIIYSDGKVKSPTTFIVGTIDEYSAINALNEYFLSDSSSTYYTIEEELGVSDGKITLFFSREIIDSKFISYTILLLAGLILVVGIVIITARLISISLTKQLTELVDSVNTDVTNLLDDFEIFTNDQNNEFGIIKHKIVELVCKIKDSYVQITDYEIKKRVLEVELLQANINPHFLYNTLSAIRWIYPDKDLTKVIDSLVKFYRIVLNRGNNILKISQEIGMISEYINIQKFAYSFFFKHEINVEEAILENYCLKNILQPIVENAILHGIRSREEGGELYIILISF